MKSKDVHPFVGKEVSVRMRRVTSEYEITGKLLVGYKNAGSKPTYVLDEGQDPNSYYVENRLTDLSLSHIVSITAISKAGDQ